MHLRDIILVYLLMDRQGQAKVIQSLAMGTTRASFLWLVRKFTKELTRGTMTPRTTASMKSLLV